MKKFQVRKGGGRESPKKIQSVGHLTPMCAYEQMRRLVFFSKMGQRKCETGETWVRADIRFSQDFFNHHFLPDRGNTWIKKNSENVA